MAIRTTTALRTEKKGDGDYNDESDDGEKRRQRLKKATVTRMMTGMMMAKKR
jgi:hypothetical protein